MRSVSGSHVTVAPKVCGKGCGQHLESSLESCVVNMVVMPSPQKPTPIRWITTRSAPYFCTKIVPSIHTRPGIINFLVSRLYTLSTPLTTTTTIYI